MHLGRHHHDLKRVVTFSRMPDVAHRRAEGPKVVHAPLLLCRDEGAEPGGRHPAVAVEGPREVRVIGESVVVCDARQTPLWAAAERALSKLETTVAHESCECASQPRLEQSREVCRMYTSRGSDDRQRDRVRQCVVHVCNGTPQGRRGANDLLAALSQRARREKVANGLLDGKIGIHSPGLVPVEHLEHARRGRVARADPVVQGEALDRLAPVAKQLDV